MTRHTLDQATAELQGDANVLRLLRQAPGSTSAELGAQAGLSSLSCSGALGRLEDAGLAAPLPDPGFPRGNPTRRRWRAL